MFVVYYERAPRCHTCRRVLESWIMFQEHPRCPRCERRCADVAIRRIFHEAKMKYIRGVTV